MFSQGAIGGINGRGQASTQLQLKKSEFIYTMDQHGEATLFYLPATVCEEGEIATLLLHAGF